MLRDCIHAQPKDEKGVKRDIFYFSFGVVVFWGFTAEEEVPLLSALSKFERIRCQKLKWTNLAFHTATR